MKNKGYRYYYGVWHELVHEVRSSSLPPLFIGSHAASAIMEVTCIKITFWSTYMSSYLSWSAHIDTVVSKARITLGFIYRKFYRSLYTTYIVYIELRKVNNASMSIMHQLDSVTPFSVQCADMN